MDRFDFNRASLIDFGNSTIQKLHKNSAISDMIESTLKDIDIEKAVTSIMGLDTIPFFDSVEQITEGEDIERNCLYLIEDKQLPYYHLRNLDYYCWRLKLMEMLLISLGWKHKRKDELTQFSDLANEFSGYMESNDKFNFYISNDNGIIAIYKLAAYFKFIPTGKMSYANLGADDEKTKNIKLKFRTAVSPIFKDAAAKENFKCIKINIDENNKPYVNYSLNGDTGSPDFFKTLISGISKNKDCETLWHANERQNYISYILPYMVPNENNHMMVVNEKKKILVTYSYVQIDDKNATYILRVFPIKIKQ